MQRINIFYTNFRFWDILYKFNKVLEINANKYGKENAMLTFIDYFDNGRTEIFTREDNSRTLIEELDREKLYELLKLFLL